MTDRYQTQLALPQLTPEHQAYLKSMKILMVGAGGLGAPALPYLAGAGIGHIAIADYDTVAIKNLHRQTTYKEIDEGKNKAELTANYLRALNSDINIYAAPEKITAENAATLCNGFDVILDGTDNFETKSLLNAVSIQLKIPLISASVEGFNGMAGIFAGFTDAPCYHCLYPELPIDACNCNDGGVLGTAAGLTGLYQAHLTLCFLLGINDIGPGTILSFDFKNLRVQNLKLPKNKDCKHCTTPTTQIKKPPVKPEIRLIHPNELQNHIIVDVRTHEEVANDPIEGALHYPLDTFTERYKELPKDRLLALACASNIRSQRAAEFLTAMGYDNVCVMDVLAG